MTDDIRKKDYEVGYGRPPKSTQFRPGNSGNPRGRPKGQKNVGTILREMLYAKITVMENGKRKKITRLEAFLMRVTKGALEGDPRAADKLLKLLPILQAALDYDAQAAEAERGAQTSHSDAAILAAFADLMRAESPVGLEEEFADAPVQ